MTKEIGVGKAHSKIILMGEHSVVYGYPAISLPLNRIEVTCQVFPSERAWNSPPYSNRPSEKLQSAVSFFD